MVHVQEMEAEEKEVVKQQHIEKGKGNSTGKGKGVAAQNDLGEKKT